MNKCPICGKVIRDYKEEPFELYGRKYHLDCLPRAIRIERKIAAKERERREQRKLDIFNEEND